jgi:hypothetical protein
MKMAKASYAEWQNLMDFANEYEELTKGWPSEEELGKLLKKYDPQFFRTIFGYATLVDYFCDPKESTLALAPDIEEVFTKAGFQLKGGNYFSDKD